MATCLGKANAKTNQPPAIRFTSLKFLNRQNLHRQKRGQWQKRGQIQLFETIAVLLVFFIIVGLSISFYFFISKQGSKKEHQRALELSAITTAQKVSTLPELDCIQVGVHLEKCFDELKIKAFQDTVAGKPVQDFYFDTLGYSRLSLQKIYPRSSPAITLYDKPPLTDASNPLAMANISIEKTFLPINTYDPLSKTYGFAVLEVTFYER